MKKIVVVIVASFLLSGCFQTKQQEFIQAIKKGDIEAVRSYIKQEKDVNFKTKNGTPLDVAMNHEQQEAAIELLKAGAKSAYMPLPPLTFAVLSVLPQGNEQNVEIAKALISKKNVKEKDAQGNTPLHYASEKGLRELVRLLVENGADVNATNKEGDTPLIVAAQSGQVEIVKFLHEHGADIHHANHEGETALLKATEGNHKTIVQYLLKMKADINEKTNSGKTPLMIAAEYGYDSLVSLLLNHGADVHVKDQTGNTALSLAQYWKHEQIIKQLKQKGAQ
ncbi:ankyrin repeat domain-containing protein [Thermolongibacillus altinsuensis]|uniref:ankyrin repeat domain-containing protein n=1 Tax=Thermolongibacillus altinsuensis TaxID=575256 RepID=UPI00242A2D2A|nr:ankyrin repeat domain-containing protein [Thermolongibacillus altinsuensis]GMB07454.1 UNC-44 ankyrin [Thermolongibacillus altinsuensis]